MISLAYYPGWVQRTLPPAGLPWDALTHVAHFGRYPLPDGTLPVADLQTEANHGPLVAAARNAGRTPLLTVGGGGSLGGQTIGANFAAACSTAAGRTRLVANVVALVERYDYSGADVDWEEGVPDHADAYVQLLADLRAAIGTRRLLTAAVVSGLVPGQIAARTLPYVDLFNVMAYWSDGSDEIAHYRAAGIPASKLVVGAGFSADPTFADGTAAAVRAKITAARAAGAAGVMFWQAGDLTPSPTSDPRLVLLREAMVPTTYPGASWRPLGAQTQPRMSSHEVVCLHTCVGFLASTDAMFRDQGFGGTESHFGVGGKWGSDAGQGLDGAVWQWQDLDFTADANLEGNPRVISIETADNAPQLPGDIEAWTPAQVDAIVDLVAWLCRTYAIPARLIADTVPGTKGIGYHAQGTAATLPAGAERWSTTVGKPCPTARRIAQITAEIIPRVQQALDQEADDMTPAQAATLDRIEALLKAVNTTTLGRIEGTVNAAASEVGVVHTVSLANLGAAVAASKAAIDAQAKALTAVAGQVTAQGTLLTTTAAQVAAGSTMLTALAANPGGMDEATLARIAADAAGAAVAEAGRHLDDVSFTVHVDPSP